jgi:DNA-binding Lrp family transcriptional regulator
MVHKTQFPLLNYFSESIHRLPINPLTILTKTQIEKYDSIDLHILAILSQNCRRTSVEISTFLKISRETVNYRIKRIISGGAIAKFQPTINFYLLGFECYFMILKLCKPTQRKRIIHFFKETQKCNTILVSASGNLMVFIQFPNNKEYRLFENKLFSHFSTAIYEYSFVLVKKQHKLEWFPEKLISYIT